MPIINGRHHLYEFRPRVERAAHFGWAEIAWWELKLWFNVERITKNVWRAIKEEFEAQETDQDLSVKRTKAGILLIASPNGCHLEDIGDLCE